MNMIAVKLHVIGALWAYTYTYIYRVIVANKLFTVQVAFGDVQTPTSNGDQNVLNSYLVNHTTSGGGNNALTALGQSWASIPC